MVYQYPYNYMMNWMLDTLGPFWWVWMAAMMGTYFSISIFLAYRVHRDAVRRGIRTPEFWMVFALLLNVVGYLLYILIRKNYALSPETQKPTR
jgi:hypothetical protein